jgi:hypothetical protein
MRGARQTKAAARPWAAGFALLALVLQLLTPPGFMLSNEDGRAAIVICTGHGPALAPGDRGGLPAKSPKSRPDAPCAFAGHGLGVAAAPEAQITAPSASPGPAAVLIRADLAPGRGLAAPPPPSQGPPSESL